MSFAYKCETQHINGIIVKLLVENDMLVASTFTKIVNKNIQFKNVLKK